MLYGADPSLPRPPGSIYHSHERADMRLMRFQEVRSLFVHLLGPGPFTGGNTGPDPSPLSLSRSQYVADLCTYLCAMWHFVPSGTLYKGLTAQKMQCELASAKMIESIS